MVNKSRIGEKVFLCGDIAKTTTPMMPLYLWAGGPSMMMLIHRICMALSGLGKFISVAKEMSVRAAMLLEASRGQA